MVVIVAADNSAVLYSCVVVINTERCRSLESVGGCGGVLRPQDTRLVEDRQKTGWLGTLSKSAQRERTAALLSRTVLREEGDVVRDDPGVQGELRELLLQILARLWPAS